MKLIFELGVEGRGMTLMPECDVPEYQLPEERSEALHLPHVSENELTRHYTALCKRIHGVNDGFYPLGSCTMKYNPKIDEDMAALPGFTQLHPLQPIETAQGALEALHTLGSELGEVFGMDAVTFQPAAGAHGEFTGVLLIKEATKKGYKEANPGDSVDLGFSGSNTRRGRVGQDIAHTLETSCIQGIVERGGRIRRLMPRECLRLQGFDEWQIDRILAIQSDAQAYKQAGNSVTANVIEAIGRRIREVDAELKAGAAA